MDSESQKVQLHPITGNLLVDQEKFDFQQEYLEYQLAQIDLEHKLQQEQEQSQDNEQDLSNIELLPCPMSLSEETQPLLDNPMSLSEETQPLLDNRLPVSGHTRPKDQSNEQSPMVEQSIKDTKQLLRELKENPNLEVTPAFKNNVVIDLHNVEMHNKYSVPEDQLDEVSVESEEVVEALNLPCDMPSWPEIKQILLQLSQVKQLEGCDSSMEDIARLANDAISFQKNNFARVAAMLVERNRQSAAETVLHLLRRMAVEAVQIEMRKPYLGVYELKGNNDRNMSPSFISSMMALTFFSAFKNEKLNLSYTVVGGLTNRSHKRCSSLSTILPQRH